MTPNYSVWPLGQTQFEGDRDWPQISIVTPNYNGGQFLPATIESVLRQQYPNLQYAILDGGSTDGSRQIIERYAERLHYWHSHSDDGQYAAIHEGFEKTSGEICGWLNSDDQHFPWTLHTVGAIFREFPEIDWLTGTPCELQRGIIHTVPFSQNGYCRSLIQAGCYGSGPLPTIQQESCFWRRNLWEKAGGLDLSYSLAADFHLWTKFAEHADLVTGYFYLGAFHRTESNRSRLQRKQYDVDISNCLKKLPEVHRSLRSRVISYQRSAHVPVWRKLHRQLAGLTQLDCPVLTRKLETGDWNLRSIPAGLSPVG